MIAQITGTFVDRQGMEVVLDCHGVGYLLQVPLSTADALPAKGSAATLLTILHVREDAMQLFGFGTVAERQTFALLTAIPGIGGRTALGILSAATLADLRLAIVRNDVAALQRLPGIGKKTAERLVLELREKILGIVPDSGPAVTSDSTVVDETTAALVALGYNRATAERAVKAALASDPGSAASADTLLRSALRNATQ